MTPPADPGEDGGGGPSPDAPIGVFDSGVGGLTVLEAVRRRLPRESTVYLGDTARLPYGPKSPETVLRYTREAAAFLLERGVKLLVVACNTASARALPRVADELPVPVVGVVHPGAEAASEVSREGRIGIVGTRGTVESGAYQSALRELRPGAEIHANPCPLFVPLVEEGWTEGIVSRLVARRYLEPLLRQRVDTIVLGCTHYPHLRGLIADVAGPGVTLVEPAEATADAAARELEARGAEAPAGAEPRQHYYVTDDADRFRELAGRWMGEAIRHLETVSLEALGEAPTAAPSA